MLAIVLMYLGIEGQFCKASINDLYVFTKENMADHREHRDSLMLDDA